MSSDVLVVRQCAAMTPGEVRLDLAGPMSFEWLWVSIESGPEQATEKGVVR